jgi:hypothetical protein
MIPVHVGPPFRSMPAGGVTRIIYHYRGLFFQPEGRDGGQEGYQCEILQVLRLKAEVFSHR